MLISHGLSVWVLLIYSSGATGILNCDHCQYGTEYCNEDTNHCLFGCIDGWTGNDCDIKCTIPNCTACELTLQGQECHRCKNGLYDKYCSSPCSFYCKYGETHCDRQGKCNYGCERGWVGDLCNRRECIIPNCQTCEEWPNGQPYCKMCDIGYYWDGFVCGECSPYCVGGRNSCNTSTGACLNGCMDNWIGANCRLQCNIDHCLQCSTELVPNRAVCTQCQSGYFLHDNTCVKCGNCKNGEICDNINGTCHNGCADRFQGDNCNIFCDIPNCEKCKVRDFNKTVCELCASGYYYNSPDSCRSCNFSCKGGPQKCDPRTGKCTAGCIVGYYGEYCSYICSRHCINNTCSPLNGNCDCEEGWFGLRCDRDCPVNCDECDGFAVSNTCSRCHQGWYGPHCEIPCPENCLQEPYRDRCDKVTGQCIMGCYGSMYGKFCNETCSPNCIGNCNQLSGNCTNGCVSAWYGPTCEQKCSSSCKDAPPGFRICDRDDGTCDFGCENGKYGHICDQTCSYKCRNRTCVMNSGDCVVCMKGFYGMNCSQLCEGHCLDSECDQLSGICTRGCDPGYFGIKCDQVCSQNCIGYKCDINTGYCIQGCINGFYGNTCIQICNKNCLNNTCQQTSGVCLQGCKSGYMGTYCVQGCSRGSYGENCEKTCGQCLNDSPCLPTSGKCSQGCALGWGKDTCDIKLQYGGTVEETTSLPIPTQAGISAAGVIFLFFLGIVIFIVYKGHHQKRMKKERDSMPVTYSVSGYSSQTVIPTDGSENYEMSNTGRKISLDYIQMTMVDMVPTISSQSVDWSQQGGISVTDRDNKMSEDKTCSSTSALLSKDAEGFIDVLDRDMKDSDVVRKRQKECIIKLKKQGIPVETYLRISTPIHIIKATCTTDDDIDNHDDDTKTKESDFHQNIESGVSSLVLGTNVLDPSVKNMKLMASAIEDVLINSESTVKDAMVNSASMRHATVTGASCSIPFGKTIDSLTQHSTLAEDLAGSCEDNLTKDLAGSCEDNLTKDSAESHEDNSTKEVKDIDVSVKSAECSASSLWMPFQSIKHLKSQKNNIGKDKDYTSLDYNSHSSGHIISNQIIDTSNKYFISSQHSNTPKLELNRCTDTINSVNSLQGINVEHTLCSSPDRDISNRSALCTGPDLAPCLKSYEYLTLNPEMCVRKRQCLTPEMDMDAKCRENLTPDMDTDAKSGKCLTPDMSSSVISSGFLTLDEDVCIVKNPENPTAGEDTCVQSVEYKNCEELDSHIKSDPSDTHNSKISKTDPPNYFGVDSQVAGTNMPHIGGSFCNKDIKDYGNSTCAEFLNNGNKLFLIRRQDSSDAVAILDSENISSQEDSYNSKLEEKSNRSLENRILQSLRSDLMRDLFKFSDDIGVYVDLQTFLYQNRLQLSNSRLYHFSVNICVGLNYLHQQKILHKLLRAKSIYLDKKMVIKIGELEWAQQGDDISDKQVALPDDYYRWMAPESLLYGKFSLHTDVWSFGLILWEIFNLGLEPFINIEPDMLIMRLQEGLRPTKPHNSDMRLYRLMKTCWRYAGDDRPSVEIILSQLSSLIKSQNPRANGELFV